MWSTKQESALCCEQGNWCSSVLSYADFSLSRLPSLIQNGNWCCSNSCCCVLPGSLPVCCISKQIRSYQNSNMTVFAIPTIPTACWQLRFADGIETWVLPGRSLGPRSCSFWAAESHYGLLIWAAMLTSVILNGFSCDHGVLLHRQFSKHLRTVSILS